MKAHMSDFGWSSLACDIDALCAYTLTIRSTRHALHLRERLRE